MMEDRILNQKDEIRQETMDEFGRLLLILKRLRRECPWDKKQTWESLRENTIEEVYELAHAVLKKENVEIKKELGDVLLHVIFYAQIAEEQGYFNIEDVCKALNEKLIFRHPHIFANEKAETSEDVEKAWEAVKMKEKDGNKTVLSGVPDALPAMIRAYRIGQKAAAVGFDWEKREDVWQKVKEEIAEFEVEAERMDAEKMEDEMGDVLFSLVNVARLYHIKPDTALEKTCEKFTARFNQVEKWVKERGQTLPDMSAEELEYLWQKAKMLQNG